MHANERLQPPSLSPAAQPAPSSAARRHVRSGRSSAFSPKQGPRLRTPPTDARDPRIPRAGLPASRGSDQLCADLGARRRFMASMTPGATAEARLPRDAGLSGAEARDVLSKVAGLLMGPV